jgi:hypothetical protein
LYYKFKIIIIIIIIIGDVHTKVSKYFEIVKDNDESIQVGDFGFKTSHDWFINNMDSNKHKIVFGNHD